MDLASSSNGPRATLDVRQPVGEVEEGAEQNTVMTSATSVTVLDIGPEIARMIAIMDSEGQEQEDEEADLTHQDAVPAHRNDVAAGAEAVVGGIVRPADPKVQLTTKRGEGPGLEIESPSHRVAAHEETVALGPEVAVGACRWRPDNLAILRTNFMEKQPVHVYFCCAYLCTKL